MNLVKAEVLLPSGLRFEDVKLVNGLPGRIPHVPTAEFIKNISRQGYTHLGLEHFEFCWENREALPNEWKKWRGEERRIFFDDDDVPHNGMVHSMCLQFHGVWSRFRIPRSSLRYCRDFSAVI